MRAKCFSEDDKRLLVERVRGNQTGMQNKTFKREQMIEAFKDPQTWCYCGIAITTTLPTSGLGAFANIIITGFDFTILETQVCYKPTERSIEIVKGMGADLLNSCLLWCWDSTSYSSSSAQHGSSRKQDKTSSSCSAS